MSLSWQVSDRTPGRQTCRHLCESVTTEVGGTNNPQRDWKAQPTPRWKTRGEGACVISFDFPSNRVLSLSPAHSVKIIHSFE